MNEIKKALKEMLRGKALGADGLSINLIKVAGNFPVDNLIVLSFKRLETCIVPST